MKIRKNIACVIAAVLTAMTLAVPETLSMPVNDVQKAFAEPSGSEEMEYGNLKYKKDGNDNGEYSYIEITGCCDEEVESIEVPAEIDGLPVYSIGKNCFMNCEKLKEVKLPDIMRVMEQGAFYGCSSLKSIEIPKSTYRIASDVFTFCDSLERIDVAEGSPYFHSVDGVLYDQYKISMLHYPTAKKDTSYEMLDTSYTMKYFYAFAYNSALKEITLPSTLENIYPSSLECCENLEKVTILNPKCDIDDEARAISNGKNENGDYYFNGTIYGYKNSTAESYAQTYGYKFEVIEGTPVSYYHDTTYYENSINTRYIKIDEDNDGTYDYVEIYEYMPSSFYDEIPAEIEGLPVRVIGFAAAQAGVIDDTKIPDTVKELRENAFCECFKMKTITLPESVEIIGKKAFFSCLVLNSITIKNPKCIIYDDKKTISNGLKDDYYFDGTIYGYPGSTAQAYAEKYGYKFEAIEGDVPDVPDPAVTTAPVTTAAAGTTVTTVTTVTTAAAETATTASETEKETTAVTHETTAETTTTTVSGSGFIAGDISGNGEIDLYDAIEIAKSLVGERKFTAEEKKIADYNGDGNVDLYDAIAIARYILNHLA